MCEHEKTAARRIDDSVQPVDGGREALEALQPVGDGGEAT